MGQKRQPPGEPDPVRSKFSFTFHKTGPARFLSHHDMMRVFERAVRRATLPIRMTAGFNPRPRMVFPHPLGVGVASRCEQIEIEFRETLEARRVLDSLRRACSDVCIVEGVSPLRATRKGQVVKASVYRLTGWHDPEALQEAITALDDAPEIRLQRGPPHRRREVNIRPWVDAIRFEDGGVWVRLRHEAAGAGRADEIAGWLCARTGTDRSRICMERIAMEMA